MDFKSANGRFESTTQFVNDMCRAAKDGYGFVPFVGSGLSVASGIPTGEDFLTYLKYCIYRVVGSGDDWTPRKKPWPRLSDAIDNGEKTEAWFTKTAAKIWRLNKQDDNNEVSTCEKEAIGAAADWRTALLFLSRVVSDEGSPPALWAPDARVLDAFLTDITKNRHPNVGHMALAHLAPGLRIHTILTTNFETLIDMAFSGLGMPLSSFDVHHSAGLPDAKLVLSQPSVVCLHGGRYGLRADFSIDETPPESDRDAFVEYFLRHPLSHEAMPPNPQATKHVLAIGASGRDGRSIALLQAALEKYPNMKLYWVCHSRSSEAMIQKSFQKSFNGRNLQKQVITTTCADLSLLLLEIYQGLHHALPPSGAEYSAFWHVPPQPHPRHHATKWRQRSKNYGKALEDAIDKARSKPDSKPDYRPAIVRVTGETGASSVVARYYYDNYHEQNFIWLELDDFLGWDDLFAAILDAISHNLGGSTKLPLFHETEIHECREYLEECIRTSQKQFVIFLNGREGPGRDAGDSDGSKKCGWDIKEINKFWSNMYTLRSKRVTFVVLCKERDKDKDDAIPAGTISVEINKDSTPSGDPTAATPDVLVSPEVDEDSAPSDDQTDTTQAEVVSLEVEEDSTPSDDPVDDTTDGTVLRNADADSGPRDNKTVVLPDGIISCEAKEESIAFITTKAVEITIDNLLKKERECLGQALDAPAESHALTFAYALTLFRHSRHATAMYSWPLIKELDQLGKDSTQLNKYVDLDEMSQALAGEWLKVMERCGAILRKPGGLYWMSVDVRESLKSSIEGRDDEAQGLGEIRSVFHQGIAGWYLKLFRSSKDPLAALESLYHRLQCIKRLKEMKKDPDRKKQLYISTLREVTGTLWTATNQILSAGHIDSFETLIQALVTACSENNFNAKETKRFRAVCAHIQMDCSRGVSKFKEAMVHSDKQLELLKETSQSVGGPKTGDNGTQAAKAAKLKLAEMTIDKAIIQTGARDYGSAEESFRSIFEGLGLTVPMYDPRIDKASDGIDASHTRTIRATGRFWASVSQPQKAIRLAVKALGRYMLLHLLIDEAEHLLQDGPAQTARTKDAKTQNAEGSDSSDKPSPRPRLTYIEHLYAMTTTILRFCSKPEVFHQNNAYVRTLYGLVLSKLTRFHEAHRRLNEASAYLAHSTRVADPVANASIALRRAEVYLSQAESARKDGKPENSHEEEETRKRRVMAFLDDAHFTLKRAQRILSDGNCRSVWWWSLMYELELKICVSVKGPRCRGQREFAEDANLEGTFCCGPCKRPRLRCIEVIDANMKLIRTDLLRLAILLELCVDLKPKNLPNNSASDAHMTIYKMGQKVYTRLKKDRKKPKNTEDLHPQIIKYIDRIKKKGEGKFDTKPS